MTDTNTTIPVLKLHETHDDARNEPSDAVSVYRIWTLLTGGETTRDLTVANRQVL